MNRTIQYKKIYNECIMIHDCAHYLWFLDGFSDIRIGEHTIIIEKDNLLFIPAYIPYKITTKTSVNFIFVTIRQQNDENNYVYVNLSSLYKRQIVNSLLNFEEPLHSKLNTEVLIPNLNEKNQKLTPDMILNIQRYKTDQRIYSTIKYIEQNFTSKISISSLAKRNYINSSYLSTLFKEYTGSTISEYLQAIRIENAINDLLTTSHKISYICQKNGFADMRTINKIFKKKFKCSPSEFRRLNFYSKDDLLINKTQSLFDKYYKDEQPNGVQKLELSLEYSFKTAVHNEVLNPFNCFAVGKASDLSLNKIQSQIQIAKVDLNFKYCTFHNIFGDDMNIFTKQSNNEYLITFTKVFECLDFLESQDIVPILELGYFPKEIASSCTAPFTGYTLNTGGKINFSLWNQLITLFFTEVNKRYKNVNKWYFSFFSAVDFKSYWPNSYLDLKRLYTQTYLSIKNINSSLQIGGFGFANIAEGDTIISHIIDGVINEQTKLDFVSIHSYPFAVEQASEYIYEKKLVDIKMSYKSDKLSIDIAKLNKLCKKYNTPIGLINEWNTIISQKEPLNDEMYKAASIIKNFILVNGKRETCTSICYWVLSDYINEHGLSRREFHGGIGLLTYNGIKKPAYYAFQLMNLIKGHIVECSDNFIVTRTNDAIQILVHNCNKSIGGETGDQQLRKDFIQSLSSFEIFFSDYNEQLNYMLTLKKIDINSSAKHWANKINENKYLSSNIINYIQKKATIQETCEIITAHEFKNMQFSIKENEVYFLEIKKNPKN